MIKFLFKIFIKIFPKSFFYLFLKKKSISFGIKEAKYALTFDLDYSKDVLVIPDLLKILKKYDIKASFACVGKWIEKYPNIHKEILAGGHEIINHTFSHYDNDELKVFRSFNELSFDERQKEIADFDDVCFKILNYKAVGFRVPHFGRSFVVDIYKILSSLDYSYSSSTSDIKYFFDKQGEVNKAFEISVGCSSKFPLFIFDSWSSRSGPNPLFKNDEEFLCEFYQTIKILKKTKSLLVHYFDPFDIIQNQKIDKMCAYLKQEHINCVLLKDAKPL